MDKQLQELIKELGEAINSSLAESDRFAEIMGEMERAGYEVFVVLEASLGFRKNNDASESHNTEIPVPVQHEIDSGGNLRMTGADLEFLRQLNISAA